MFSSFNPDAIRTPYGLHTPEKSNPTALAWMSVGAGDEWTSHARAKGDAADQAARSASQDSDIARTVARELSPGFHQPGPDYVRQKYNEPLEVNEFPVEEKKEKSPSRSPHFYRKGTTPDQSPTPSPTASPTLVKNTSFSSKSPAATATAPTKPAGKENKTPAAESVKGMTKAASKLSLRQEARLPEAPPAVKPATISSYPSNGQIHSQYHGYYVKADVKMPPPEDPIGAEDDLHPSSLACLPPPAKPIWAPAPKALPAAGPPPAPVKEAAKAPEPAKPKRAESTKPRSLADTKKASMEIASETLEEESFSARGKDTTLYSGVILGEERRRENSTREKTKETSLEPMVFIEEEQLDCGAAEGQLRPCPTVWGVHTIALDQKVRWSEPSGGHRYANERRAPNLNQLPFHRSSLLGRGTPCGRRRAEDSSAAELQKVGSGFHLYFILDR
ncbi:Junctophilin-1 [Liparis tanakae]|uniref:Junctophilin-1 n=1 Tax=Liparis tanakae TaxID=230148 RepID=A0A4Z2GZC9_9TELE|nr:Junctophilin-1 [Liparis tanakae]